MEPGRIPPYRIEALIGIGATARVYRAVHEETGAVVALKLLAAEADARARAFFARET